MKLKLSKKVFLSALLFPIAFSATANSSDGKYLVIKKEEGAWGVVALSDEFPAYQDGMEILSASKLTPQFDPKFKIIRSQYGGIECPSVSDKSMYTPCNSYFYRFVGANFFGLGGVRQDFSKVKYEEVMAAISSDERVIAIKMKAEEEAARQAQVKREAEETRAQERRREEERRAEQARIERERINAAKNENLRKMAKADRGLEDSCKRTDLARYVVRLDPDDVEVNCQFGGLVDLLSLKEAGWLVASRIKDKDNVVTEYFIRKAR